MLGVLFKVRRRNFDGVAVCKLHPIELLANSAAAMAGRMNALCPRTARELPGESLA